MKRAVLSRRGVVWRITVLFPAGVDPGAKGVAVAAFVFKIGDGADGQD